MGKPWQLQLAQKIRERTKDGDSLINCMVDIVNSDTAADTDKISAAKWLADRCWGKPVETIVTHEGEALPRITLSKVS